MGACGRSPVQAGLVTAVGPVLQDRGGIWIGWPGTTAGREEIDRAVADASEQLGYAAIYRAWGMTGERRGRMRRLQRSIRKHDVFWWAEEFLRAAATTEVSTLQDAEERVVKPVFDHLFRPAAGEAASKVTYP